MFRLNKFFVITLSLFVTVINCERVRYDNYRVYKVIPNSNEQAKILNDLANSSDSLIFLEDVQFIGKSIHIVVAPHKQLDFVEILTRNGLTYELKENNLQHKLDFETVQLQRSFTNKTYDWQSYHTLEETYNWLRSLAEKYPEYVEVVEGGKTYEGRNILGVKVSFGEGNKGVFLEGGIHAREWIAPATVTYILNQVLTNQDPNVRQLVEQFDWYVFPHANPDGFVYTHTGNRLWRKTRKPYGVCYGVDPNRNWDFHWDEAGTSSNPCTDTFSGPKAFSEIDTKSFSKYIGSLQGKLHTYIAFHSFSQLILFPYGHTSEHAPNHDDLQEIGDVAAKELSKRYGTKYTVGNIYKTIYPASGASMDWAYGVVKVPITYTYELRPRSGSWDGFILPPQQIIPTGEETFDSILALLEHSKSLGYYD